MLWTIQFWREAAERAIKSAAGGALLVIGADQASVLTLDFANVAGFAGGAALISLLMSLASSPFGTPGTPSLVKGGE